jgi:hypothetical protein
VRRFLFLNLRRCCCGTRRIWWSGSSLSNSPSYYPPDEQWALRSGFGCVRGERGKGLRGCCADWSLVGAIGHPSLLPPPRARSALAGGEPGQGRAWHWPPADFLCSGTPMPTWRALIYGYSVRRLSYLVSRLHSSAKHG